MAQDWLNTLDYDFGGLHPGTADQPAPRFTGLRFGIISATTPADPIEGRTWPAKAD